MKIVELYTTGESTFDKKNPSVVTYFTNYETKARGIILLENPDGNHNLIVTQQMHNNGPVKVTVKVFQSPAKKFGANELIGYIVEL